MKLSKVAEDIANTVTYENFDLIYYDFDIRPSIELWVRSLRYLISNFLVAYEQFQFSSLN